MNTPQKYTSKIHLKNTPQKYTSKIHLKNASQKCFSPEIWLSNITNFERKTAEVTCV
jgi:hypothetical protein